MSYTIQSGDNLWNIAKQQYNLTNNKDIQTKIEEIAKENNITDINSIISGSNLNLPGLESNNDTSGSVFTDWANSSSNYENYSTGNKVDDFQMFDYSSLGDTPEEIGKAYNKKIEEFSQDYIDKYDLDKNKEIDFEEFKKIEYGDGPEDPQMESLLRANFLALGTSSQGDEKLIGEEGVTNLLTGIPGVTLEEEFDAKAVIERYDQNGDGKLSYEEVGKIQFYGLEASNFISEDSFNLVSDNDVSAHSIDAKEYSAFFALADSLDENNIDGNISYDAYAKVMSSSPDDVAEKTQEYYNFIFNDEE